MKDARKSKKITLASSQIWKYRTKPLLKKYALSYIIEYSMKRKGKTDE